MGVAVVLERPGDPLTPGSEFASDIRVRNTGAVVDQVALDIVGEAAAWARVEPASLNLMPGQEATARLVFAPPRSAKVAAGPVPFALRAMSREDTAGSSIEESTVTIGQFSQIAAELVPRNSTGRFAGRHEIALDNLGNHQELASVNAFDADRLLKFKVEPTNVTVAPGTAHFVKIKAKPHKSFWLGPNKTIPFQVIVTGENAEQIPLQGAVLQRAILPPWFLKAIVVLIAIAIALAALWLAFLKPVVESTAKAVVEDETEDLVAAVAEGNEIAKEANELAKKAAQDAEKNSDDPGGGTKGQKNTDPNGDGTGNNDKEKKDKNKKNKRDGPGPGPAGPTLDSARAEDFRITTAAAPGASFQTFSQPVPKKKVLWISDIVLQNPNGDTGTLEIRRGDTVLFEFGLENFRDLDYHLIQPVSFAEDDVVVAVRCRNATGSCTPSVYFAGLVTKAPKQVD